MTKAGKAESADRMIAVVCATLLLVTGSPLAGAPPIGGAACAVGCGSFCLAPGEPTIHR